MNFKVREMSFEEADRRYAELTRQHDDGSISDDEFDAQRRQLVVRDGEGGRWAKIGPSGDWHYRDGGAWVRGTPPRHHEIAPDHLVGVPPPHSPSDQPPEIAGNGENGGSKTTTWLTVAAVGTLAGIALVVWVLVPYLRGEPAGGMQSDAMSVNGSEAMAPDGPGAVFVHRATSETISANSTYLDNDLINGSPNAIISVTQNWNPQGDGGTYNDHNVGVWYDAESRRWAIFNQDRARMPDGAAFNVVVLGAK